MFYLRCIKIYEIGINKHVYNFNPKIFLERNILIILRVDTAGFLDSYRSLREDINNTF